VDVVIAPVPLVNASFSVISANIAISRIFLKLDTLDYICVVDIVGLSATTLT